MGMAAGQARLLSITSRMSDNELRAQLINNDKMRLATQSAQVSEAYVQALNDTQMMFTNYDADNNTSYQQLTFNSLTAFNPYNNQYALSNSSGQVLVSEKDALNFEAANGDLNTFLALYGLEETTTYFDNLGKEYIFSKGEEDKAGNIIDRDGEVAYYTGNTLNDGSMKLITTGYTAEELEAMYLGTTLNGVKYNGYYNTIQSNYYYDYTKNLADFSEKFDTHCATTALLMDEKLSNLTTTDANGATKDQTLEKLKNTVKEYQGKYSNDASSVSLDDARTLLNTVQNFLDQAAVYKNTTTGTKYFDEATTLISDAKNGGTTYDSGSFGTLDADGKSTSQYIYSYQNGKLCIAVDTEENEDGTYSLIKDKSGNPVYNYVITVGSSITLTAYNTEGTTLVDGDGNPIPDANGEEQIDTSTIGNSLGAKSIAYDKNAASYSFTIGAGTDNEVTITLPANIINTIYNDKQNSTTSTFDDSAIQLTEEREPEVGNMLSTASEILSSLEKAIYTAWDTGNSAFNPQASWETNGTTAQKTAWTAYKACQESAIALYETIFGEGTAPSDIDSWFPMLQDPELLWAEVQANCAPSSTEYQQFKNIYEVLTLDRVMNTFGEPKIAWIDTSNVTDSYNENGDAKAQWYTNLFTRMQDGGYKTLQDGLASSTEWIQFALESGLVTLEQVDSKYAWNTLTYTSCSDITEQTDSNAITVAEAEYNAAMNKIENKDKMYDLELKNIDTEHNSLETEYESIKSAIDKNVERTFKIYS